MTTINITDARKNIRKNLEKEREERKILLDQLEKNENRIKVLEALNKLSQTDFEGVLGV